MSVFDVEGNPVEKKKIRVCGFNVGNFSGGGSGTPVGTDELYNKFIDTFMLCKADIYMFPEWDVNWNGSELSKDVLGFLKPYHSTFCRSDDSHQEYMGLMNYSAFEITGEYYEWYTVDQYRYFIDNTIEINGKSIHFICVHFRLDTKVNAMKEMQQVIDYLDDNNITSYIIGGDMNLGLGSDVTGGADARREAALEEITLLTSLGGHSVQGSKWGLKDKDYLFNTVGHSGRYHAPSGTSIGHYDNFILSPDITLNNVELVITEASDHDALCIDIEL